MPSFVREVLKKQIHCFPIVCVVVCRSTHEKKCQTFYKRDVEETAGILVLADSLSLGADSQNPLRLKTINIQINLQEIKNIVSNL